MTNAKSCQKKRKFANFPVLRRFRCDESGNITVETVLWLPVYMMLLALVADASLMFYSRSQALQVVQDANRALAVGRLPGTAEAEDMIRQNLAQISPGAIILTEMQDGVIRSSARMPAGELTGTGLLNAFSNLTVVASAQHLSEN